MQGQGAQLLVVEDNPSISEHWDMQGDTGLFGILSFINNSEQFKGHETITILSFHWL